MNRSTTRTKSSLRRTAVARLLALCIGASLLIAGATHAPAQQATLWAYPTTPITVDPNPVALGFPITVSCQVAATFDVDHITTTFGDYVTQNGTFNGQRYNRTRTMRVVAYVYPTDGKTMMVRVTGELEITMNFTGEGPHDYIGTYLPPQVVGPWTRTLLVTAAEQIVATTTLYTEYWYKSGNRMTKVGTSAGSLPTKNTSTGNAYQYVPFSYEVVGGPAPK